MKVLWSIIIIFDRHFIVRCLFMLDNINDMYDVSKSSILYPKEVSHSNFDPLTKLPIVMWK